MQALMKRALCRAPKLFKGAPISFSQQFSSYHHYHMFSSTKQQRGMENQVFFSGEEDIQQGYREDMVESYGIAYATRCSDEGYGERYEESVRENMDKEDMKVSLGLAHATRCVGKGYKEGYEESITLSNQHVGDEDMAKSFGLAYATRCFDEGYGDRYGESVEVGGKWGEGIEVLGNQNLEEKDMGKADFPRGFFDKGYNGRHGDQKVDEEDHMTKSFGLAYATRCSDEGYGERYGESIKVLRHQKVDEKDMTESFGLAYATRCSDEGYGERYGESIKVLRHRKNAREMELQGHY